MLDRARFVLPFALIVGVVFACYAHTFSFPFNYDDKTTVTHAFIDADGLQWSRLWSEYSGRFIPMTSLALQAHLHIDNVVPFHLVNTAIHILMCMVLFILLRHMLGQTNWKLALFVTLVFAAHPLNTQAVTYISQRLASTVALFYLTSVLMYLQYARTRKIRTLAYSTAFAIIAALSKQNAATIAGSWLLIEIFFGKETRSSWKSAKPALIAAIGVTLFVVFLEFRQTSATRSDIAVDVSQPTQPGFILTQPLVLLEYIRLFVWPVGQSVERDVTPATNVTDLRFVIPILLHVGIVIGALLVPWKNRAMVGFGVLLFYLSLMPESSLFPLEYFAEHRMYLPMTGLLMATAGIILQFGSRLDQRLKVAGLVTGFMIVIAFGVATYKRNHVWESRKTLWTDVMLKAPKRFRGYHNVGIAAILEGDYKYAIEVYLRAIKIEPQLPALYNNLGHAAEKLPDRKLAAQAFAKLVELQPTPENHRVLAHAYLKIGLFDRAIVHAKICLEKTPSDTTCLETRDQAKKRIIK